MILLTMCRSKLNNVRAASRTFRRAGNCSCAVGACPFVNGFLEQFWSFQNGFYFVLVAVV